MAGLIKGVMSAFADDQYSYAPLNEDWPEVLLHGGLRIHIKSCRDLHNADSGIVGRLTGDKSDVVVAVVAEGVRLFKSQVHENCDGAKVNEKVDLEIA